MKYIAAFDIGTTAVKGTLVSETGELLASQSIDIETIFQGDFKEQNPKDWYNAFCSISKGFMKKYKPETILGIIFSGQMQDLIFLDSLGESIGNAILYSDGRAEEEACQIQNYIEKKAGKPASYINDITGNNFDGSMPVAKLRWVKNHEPERFVQVSKVLISAKDFIMFRLTQQPVSDVTACATSGAMNIREKVWDKLILEAAGVNEGLFPKLCHSHEKAGVITGEASAETGYATGTPVYAGVGDAGATTLASGISEKGHYNINLGTSGWVATVSDGAMSGNVFNLAAMPENRYINVVPFFNAGNVHKWICGMFEGHADEAGDTVIDYAKAEAVIKAAEPGSGGVMCLPYLLGERFPVVDSHIKGCFVNLTPETQKGHMMRAALEGVAFSIRQGIEAIGVAPKKISIIGGGARSNAWCQILSEVLNQKVYVYKNAEVLPAVAISAAVLIGEGKMSDYTQFTDSLQTPEQCIAYTPIAENVATYDRIYKEYTRLYPIVKQL